MNISTEHRTFCRQFNPPLGDTSQAGNRSCFRNLILNKKPFTIVSKWVIPSTGLIEFDFVRYCDPASDTTSLDSIAFFNFSKRMTDGLFLNADTATLKRRNEWQAKTLSMLSRNVKSNESNTVGPNSPNNHSRGRGRRLGVLHVTKGQAEKKDDVLKTILQQCKIRNIVFNARQVANLIEAFDVAEESNQSPYRLDIAVNLFDRLTDLENFFIIQQMMNRAEKIQLQHKLGILNIISFNQPIGKYNLNLGQFDEWLAATGLFQLRLIEDGFSEFKDMFYDGNSANLKNNS